MSAYNYDDYLKWGGAGAILMGGMMLYASTFDGATSTIAGLGLISKPTPRPTKIVTLITNKPTSGSKKAPVQSTTTTFTLMNEDEPILTTLINKGVPKEMGSVGINKVGVSKLNQTLKQTWKTFFNGSIPSSIQVDVNLPY
jgi:hypothetical protein